MTSTTFKILIIENSLIKSRKIKKFFLPKGKYQFKTYESRDLTEALKKLAKKKFNVILANPDLPNTNPLNTFSKIRFSAPNTPLILISEKNDPFLEQQAIKGGAYSFLLFGEYLRHVLPQAVRFAIEKQQAQNFLINTIEDLRQSEEGWKSLVKNVTDFVYMIDRNGKILFINRVLSDLSYDQVLNSTVFDYIDPIYHDSVRSTIEKCFESGEPGTYETIARGPQMTQSIYLSRVGPIYQNEEVESLAIISSDITEQKRLETELLNSRKLEAIGHLAGGIAHDFNNILTSILGYSSLLLENKKLDNLIKQDIKEINEDALRAAGLTKQLLAFSRKQMLQPTTINLNSVVRSMEKMLKRLIGERIKLKIHLEPQLLNIKADVSQIEQVIMNLVINSRDAIKSSGEITISTSAENLPEENNKSHILLKVKDNGMGMDEDTQKRIFEPFFSTKKETKKGTGLGLSTVYGIIIQSGGKINFESTKETGTTFKIYFPSTEESIHNKTKNHELLIKKHNGTAMIVEDEDSVRRLAGRALIEKGYKVIEAKNGIQALQLCKKNIGAIDLLLTDVVMPKINGREVAEKFLLSYKDIKVLYMSGYTEDNSFLKEILEEGAHFLPKPFSPQTLTTKVQQLLNSNN